MIGKYCKLFDDDLLLNMINKTFVVIVFAQSHVLIFREAIWVSNIIITIITLINSKNKRSELQLTIR